MQALLSTAYFGPVQWYQKLCRYDTVLIERHDSYRKQTFRNRCVIATANGPQTLTVPVERDGAVTVRDIRMSDHGNWRRLHWHALTTAYSESPFFDYYADDLRPFFERRWDYLYDFNMEACAKVCELLDISTHIRPTDEYVRNEECGCLHDSSASVTEISSIVDFRDAIDPKHPQPDPSFLPRRYYQVYERRHGFLPNLSILDLLFNMGPEGIFWLL